MSKISKYAFYSKLQIPRIIISYRNILWKGGIHKLQTYSTILIKTAHFTSHIVQQEQYHGINDSKSRISANTKIREINRIIRRMDAGTVKWVGSGTRCWDCKTLVSKFSKYFPKLLWAILKASARLL